MCPYAVGLDAVDWLAAGARLVPIISGIKSIAERENAVHSFFRLAFGRGEAPTLRVSIGVIEREVGVGAFHTRLARPSGCRRP